MKDSIKNDKDTVRVNFEFPKDQYDLLKMLCAQKGISLKDLASEALLKIIEDYEDEFFISKAKERLKSMKKEDIISWEEAKKEADWNE